MNFHRTARQLDWRWDNLRGGANYSIVNITASNERDLEEEIKIVMQANPFRELLAQNP